MVMLTQFLVLSKWILTIWLCLETLGESHITLETGIKMTLTELMLLPHKFFLLSIQEHQTQTLFLLWKPQISLNTVALGAALTITKSLIPTYGFPPPSPPASPIAAKGYGCAPAAALRPNPAPGPALVEFEAPASLAVAPDDY
jgi:hypothetical protein